MRPDKMKIIDVHVSIRTAGGERSVEIQVDENATEDDIEVAAREAMFEMIDWGWSVRGAAPAAAS
jgi:hypothetical protein